MDILELLKGAAANCSAEDFLAQRGTLLEMSCAANDAVVTPRNPGRLSYPLRLAIAARISRQCKVDTLRQIYLERLAGLPESDRWSAVADTSAQPSMDTFTTAIVAYSDLVTLRPAKATRKDIVILQKSGLEDADIVQLAELVACINYLTRLVPGLCALETAS